MKYPEYGGLNYERSSREIQRIIERCAELGATRKSDIDRLIILSDIRERQYEAAQQ